MLQLTCSFDDNWQTSLSNSKTFVQNFAFHVLNSRAIKD